jgi:hypothetical protein
MESILGLLKRLQIRALYYDQGFSVGTGYNNPHPPPFHCLSARIHWYKKIFVVPPKLYKEIQMGAVAKSYIRKGFLIYEEIIYDFATAPYLISLYMRNILFSFLSV